MSSKFTCFFVLIALLFGLAHINVVHTLAQGEGFLESFDDSTLPGWDYSEGVTVVDGMLRIEPGNFSVRPGDWDDYALTMSVRGSGNGDLLIGFRISAAGGYILSMGVSGLVLQREAGGQVESVAAAEIVFEPDTWYTLSIEIRDGKISVSLPDSILLEYGDTDPLPSGGVSFETMGGLTAEIDQVSLVPLETEQTQSAENSPEVGQSSDESTSNSSLTWIRLGGPPGGTGYDIRYNFADPNIWYVTDANAGVHISIDNGLTWQDSSLGIPGNSGPTVDAKGIFCLTVDPHNPQIVWAGTISVGHIYRSVDGGRTWEQRDNGVTIKYDQLSFRGFTVDPRSSDIVYAMGETTFEALGGPPPGNVEIGGVIYKTTDGGANWELQWDGGMPSSLARYLWIDPRNPDVLYVSTGIFDRNAIGHTIWQGDPAVDPYGGLGILKSTDGGQTWRVLDKNNGLRNLYIGSLFMHPGNPDILLAAAGHSGGGIDMQPYLEYLYADGQPGPMGIFRTEDGGEHWSQTLASFDTFSSVEICPSNPDIAYAGSPNTIYRSEDAGQTWTLVADPWGPPGVVVGFPIDMQCDPRDPNRIFINNYGGGNFLSEDGGRTWYIASQGYSGFQAFNVAIDQQYPARVYASGFNGIWRSDDGGVAWTGIQFQPPDYDGFYALAVDPKNSDHILSGRGGIVDSHDSGDNWMVRWYIEQAIAQNVSLEIAAGSTPTIVYVPSNSAKIYAGFAEEWCVLYHEHACTTPATSVLVSHDNGETWQRAVDDDIRDLSVIDMAVDYDDENIVYAATGIGLYKSLDGGNDWVVLPGLPDNFPVFSVAVNPNDPLYLLVGIEKDGVYRSLDGGMSWQHSSAGLEPNGIINDIVFDPVNPQVVYSSDFHSGVYRSLDGGDRWTKINDGLLSRATSSLAISMDGQHLYVGTNEGGVYRLDLNGQTPEANER